jgi:hypothetical protein
LEEGRKIRFDIGEGSMWKGTDYTGEEAMWKGTDFMVCSRCKQVVRKEEIQRNLHTCWDSREIVSEVILS